MTYPIGPEEARADAAHARRSLARMEREKAKLVAQVAEVERHIAGCHTMLRTICGVYPELAEYTQEEVPR